MPDNVTVKGPDGKTYQFPAGTTKEVAVSYFKKKGISAPGAAAKPKADPLNPTPLNQDWSGAKGISAQPSLGSRLWSAMKNDGPAGLGAELGGSMRRPLEESTMPVPGTGKTVGEAMHGQADFAKLLGTALSLTGGEGLAGEAALGKTAETIQSGLNKIPRSVTKKGAGEAINQVEKLHGAKVINADAPLQLAKGALGRSNAPDLLKEFVEKASSGNITAREAREFVMDAWDAVKSAPPSARGRLAEFATALQKQIVERVPEYGKALQDYRTVNQLQKLVKGSALAGGGYGLYEALRNLLTSAKTLNPSR